ncbi:IclR family transcriptional regulator [Streptomyces sp. NPDC051320]|uniref:IclR family transcriptional regulator n=1 Tax=Streptomyces sp. NPDC051320 TaxID=3154644 RepID=UPI0034361181
MSTPPGDDMLGRGLRLLTVLADLPAGAGVSAIARQAQLPVSSAHRLLGRLTAEGFVAYDEDARRYALGVRVLELARGFQRTEAGWAGASAPLRRLASRTGLPAIAGVLDGDEVLLVLTAEGTQHLQLRSAEGTRNLWHATSLGKALAAALPDEEREKLLAEGLSAVTPRTCVDAADLREQLVQVRARGWAEVDEENEIGVRSVAVTVPDMGRGGRPRLAVSLGAAVALTSQQELRAHVPALHACASDIAARLG